IFKAFDTALQLAPINTFLSFDFNGDGKEEVLVGGNYFGVSPYHGRFGSLAGNIITSEGEILEGDHLGVDFTQKSVRSLNIVNFQGVPYLLVTFNDEKAEVFRLRSIPRIF